MLGPRKIDFVSLGQILTATPQVELLLVIYHEHHMKRELLRREHWNGIASALSSFHALKILHLHCEHGQPRNHSYHPGDMRRSDETVDITTVALRKLILHRDSSLKELHLTGSFPVSPKLFHGGDIQKDAADPEKQLNPNVEIIYIEANARTPEGNWYYTGDPEAVPGEEPPFFFGEDNQNDQEDGEGWETDSEYSIDSEVPDVIDERKEDFLNGVDPLHMWREQIDEQTFNSLLSGMVRSVLHLPKLKRLGFSIGEHTGDCRHIRIECGVAGQIIEGVDAGTWSDEQIGKRFWRMWVGYRLLWKHSPQIGRLMRRWVGSDGLVQRRADAKGIPQVAHHSTSWQDPSAES